MRRIAVLIVAAVAAALLLSSSPAPAGAGAGATTDVYVVHGLNLDFQASPSDGGTAVTVCAGPVSLIPDFQFGDVVGPVALPSDQAVSVQVYGGAAVDCEATLDVPLIDQSVTPTGAAVAVVATSNDPQGVPELLPIPIDTTCVETGSGRAVAVHAANAPEVDVVNTDLGTSIGTISYGEQISGPLPVGTYGIEIYIVGGPATPITSFDVEAIAETVNLGIAVGNQPVDGGTPIVLITLPIAVGACAPLTPPPAAAPVAAAPSFTG